MVYTPLIIGIVVTIASSVAIAANAVVKESCLDEGVTLDVIPAKVISYNGMKRMIKRRFPCKHRIGAIHGTSIKPDKKNQSSVGFE